MSPAHPSPWPTANVLPSCLERLPLSPVKHLLKKKKCGRCRKGETKKESHPGREKVGFYQIFVAFSLLKLKLPVTSTFKASLSTSLFLFSPGSHFPLLSVYFPHCAYELSGYNETFRDILRVTGHDANSGFAACVRLSAWALVWPGRTTHPLLTHFSFHI